MATCIVFISIFIIGILIGIMIRACAKKLAEIRRLIGK